MAAKASTLADAIDFETSDDVDVTPTFDALGLREDLVRGIYAYGKRASKCGVEITGIYRIREAVCHPAACHQAHRERARRHCPVSADDYRVVNLI